MLDLIKAENYSGALVVGVHGDPAFASDPAGANKRSDASCLGIVSTSSEQTLSSMGFFGQEFEGVTAIPVGSEDTSFTINFSKSLVITLANNQLNLYARYADRDVFALGAAANGNEFLEYRVVATKIFLQQYINKQLMVYFTPANLRYDASGVTTVFGELQTILKQMAASNVIEAGFVITPPTLDPTAVSPKILGPWKLGLAVGDTVFGLTVDGTISA